MVKKKFPSLILFILCLLSLPLLSFRLTQVPSGLTVDESSLGWNAALLAKTAHDENGVYLPLFVHSINKSDWRQPLTMYYQTIFFKIFGISIFNLRFSSVLIIIFSACLLYYLISRLLNQATALLAFILFIFTPLIFMHSHLALDNIMPLPLTLLWLIQIYRFHQYHRPRSLFWAAIFLVLSFYSYKGMRAIFPVWTLLTFITALVFYWPKYARHSLRLLLPFFTVIFLFIFSLPLVHYFYPGSIFGGARPKFDNIYNFAYPYLSHLDLSFLFIKGDELLFHSTRIHGAYLLSLLPLFIYGLFLATNRFKKTSTLKNFYAFILAAYLFGPLLMGLVDSVHRASRTIALAPLSIIIVSLAVSTLLKQRLGRYILLLNLVLILFNFLDFLKYYWYTYPKFTENIFGNMTRELDYRQFSQYSRELKLKPAVRADIYEGFFDNIYFSQPSLIVPAAALPPANSLYLTPDPNLAGLTPVAKTAQYYLYLIPPN